MKDFLVTRPQVFLGWHWVSINKLQQHELIRQNKDRGVHQPQRQEAPKSPHPRQYRLRD